METILPRKIQRVPIDSLKPFPGNSRKGDIDGIRASLRRNGQFRALLVQESTRFVVYGNQTMAAALAEGWTEIDVIIATLSDEDAERINIADNRYSDLATDDERLLLPRLEKFTDLDGTGFATLDVEAMRARLEPPEAPERAVPSDLVACKVGTLAWTMTADEWAQAQTELDAVVGPDPEAQIAEVRSRLFG